MRFLAEVVLTKHGLRETLGYRVFVTNLAQPFKGQAAG